jgi:hypothetical protein
LTCLFNRLIDPYRVASSNDLEENSNFHIVDNIFVNIDFEELNNVLNSNEHTQEDEDCDWDEDESMDEEEDKSD